MPRRPNQTARINPEAQKYQDLYRKTGSNPDSFANVVIEKFITDSIDVKNIPQQINLIEKIFNDTDKLVFIKNLLSTQYKVSNGFSLILFKTCLDKLFLDTPPKLNIKELLYNLLSCTIKLKEEKDKLSSPSSGREEDPQYNEMMIYFLDKIKDLTDFDKSRILRKNILDLLKLPRISDELQSKITSSLKLRSKALISVVKGDNKTLISEIFNYSEKFIHFRHNGKGILDYAFAEKNKDAIILLYGFTNINKYTNPEIIKAFNEIIADFQPILRFGLEIGRKTDESQKFIHTFKNLSDDGKKHLFSKFLERKKFPNSASTLIPQELQDFFATFRQDEVAFQNLADLIRDKPENQEFIALINGSNLFDQDFKDNLKFKSQTLAERLIVDFNSLHNDDERKALLTNILQNINPKISSTESPSSQIAPLEDDDVYNFFKIFLRDKANEDLFDKFRDDDEEFAGFRMKKTDLIEPIHDELDLEDFINFLNIFSSYDFKEKSEKIKGQVKDYVSDFEKDSSLAFKRAFEAHENHLALSNLYLNYPEETKEIFTGEKLAILLYYDLQVEQKQKLLIKVLEMDSDEGEKLNLIKFALKSTWDKGKIFFPNTESAEAQELLEKLNAQQITQILLETLFEEIDSENLEYLKNKNADEKYFIKFLFESPRFNYQERSDFLDKSCEENLNLVRQAINSNNEGSIDLMQNFSINLINLELIDNLFDFSSELKAKLLSTALDSENINSEEKITLLTTLLVIDDKEKLNLIYDYFLNKDLASAQELLTQEVVGALFKSNLDQEKKLDLGKKILGDDGLDEEFKKSFYDCLPAEFRSALNLDPEYVKSEVELALSEIISKLEAKQSADFSAQRVNKSRSPSPYQIPSQESSSPIEVDSNGSSPLNLGLSESTLSTASSFSVIRKIEGSSGSQSPDEQEISAGLASPVEQGAPNSPSSITGATIGVGSSGPEISSAIAIVDNVLSAEDCEELQILLTGRVSSGFRGVRSYTSEDFICDSPLKIFNVNFIKNNPSGNAGITKANKALKEEFHNNLFDTLVEKIYQSDVKFDEQRLKSYLYAILAISTGESNSIPSFFECYDHLITKTRRANTVGPGHGSWIDRPENYVKLKMIIKEMERIHNESFKGRNPAFTEKNLHNWMRAQIQDRKIEEFNYLENKEFVQNLIKASDDKSSDAKKSELGIVKESFKKLLNQNTNFLDKLAKFSVSTDENENEDKDLANLLLDDLFNKLSSKNFNFGGVAQDTYNLQLRDLRENLTTKINAFKTKLSSGKLSELDTDDDHLILDLILEIPTKFDDILKTKLEGNSFKIEGKIEDFTEKLGTRKSIFAFRKTCASQAEVYANKARELGASPAKSGPAR